VFQRPQCLLALTVLGHLCAAVTAIVFPQIAKRHLHVSPEMLGLYGGISSFAYVCSAWGSGRIADRYGQRVVLTCAGALLALGFAASLVTMHHLLFIIPFFLTGAGFGGVWPALESALIEGQSPGQMKRAMGVFNTCWMSVSAASYIISSAIYQMNYLVPLWSAVCIAAFLALLVNFPGAMEIAPWGSETRFDHAERVPASKRLLFIRLAFLANFASFLLVGNLRSLLPEYAAKPSVNIVGWRYGLLMSGFVIGMFFSNAILMRWHRWHYSFRYLLVAAIADAALLVAFVMTDSYFLLVTVMVLIGLPAGLFYYSSLFYGMEMHEKKGAHGSNHEALIGVGASVGPLVGGWVIALCQRADVSFAARSNFLMCAGCFVVAVLAQIWLLVRYTKRHAVRQ
jgi:MFS family permease